MSNAGLKPEMRPAFEALFGKDRAEELHQALIREAKAEEEAIQAIFSGEVTEAMYNNLKVACLEVDLLEAKLIRDFGARKIAEVLGNNPPHRAVTFN